MIHPSANTTHRGVQIDGYLFYDFHVEVKDVLNLSVVFVSTSVVLTGAVLGAYQVYI